MGRAVPAVVRALDILELFLDGETLSAPQITTRLSLPRTTVHELLHTLIDRHYLSQVPDRAGYYRLGMRVFQLGGVFGGQLDLAREGQSVAAEVAALCEETVHVAVLEGTEVVYVAKVDSTQPVRMVSAVGRRLPAHCTSVGKLLLAMLSPAEVTARYPGREPLPTMTPNSIRSLAALRRELTRIRDRGLAYERCESNDAVACVAAPVRDHDGEVVAAMSISVPILRWDAGRSDQLGALVAD
ncbi:MAG: IclR family transcriptional regulator, partial [Actinocatenispora sp.]